MLLNLINMIKRSSVPKQLIGPHSYYYKERDGLMCVNVPVPDGNIVCVERYYSASKSFHWLKRMIVRVKYAKK